MKLKSSRRLAALLLSATALTAPAPALAAPYSYVTVTENGSTNIVTVPFPYLNQSDVTVSVGGVTTTAYTWLTSSTLQLTASAASLAGQTVTVQRHTSITAPDVTFQSGSLDPNDLNTDTLQELYANQEATDEITLFIATGGVVPVPVPLPPTGCYSLNAFGADPTGAAFSDSAVAAILNTMGTNGGCIQAGGGTYKFANAWTINLGATGNTVAGGGLTIAGAGSQTTRLSWPATGGIRITIADGLETFHVSGVSLLGGSGTTSFDALGIQSSVFEPTNRQNTIDDVTCEGLDRNQGTGQADYWAYCVTSTLINNLNYRNLLVYGSSANLGGGINAQGSSSLSQFAIVHNVSDSAFFNTSVGFNYGTYLQGATIRNSNFTNGTTGILEASGVQQAFQLTVSDNQFNVLGNGVEVDFDNYGVDIHDNMFFVPSNKSGVQITAARGWTIHGNSFLPVSGATSTIGINAVQDDGTGPNLIEGNLFGFGSGTALTKGIELAAASTNWTVSGNKYNTVTTNYTNSGTNNIVLDPSPKPAIAACGGGTPTISADATDDYGLVTEGTSATGCTVGFTRTYTNNRTCLVVPIAPGSSPVTLEATNTVSLTWTNASLSGFAFAYRCQGS